MDLLLEKWSNKKTGNYKKNKKDNEWKYYYENGVLQQKGVFSGSTRGFVGMVVSKWSKKKKRRIYQR